MDGVGNGDWEDDLNCRLGIKKEIVYVIFCLGEVEKLLSARLTRTQTREIKGVIDRTAADLELNQINNALTILIDRL